MPNTNCLTGFRCPKCGFEDNVYLPGETIFHVFDNGTETFGNVSFQDETEGLEARCGNPECTYQGPFDDFRAMTAHERAATLTEVFMRCSKNPQYLEGFIDEQTKDWKYSEYLAVFPEEEGKERK